MVVLAWTAIIAPLLISYLGPIFDVASSQLLTALDGSGGREVGTGARRHAHSHLGADGDGRLDPAVDGDAGAGRLAGLAAGQPRADQGALHPAGHRPDLSLPCRWPGSPRPPREVADRASTFVTLAMALVVAAWLAPRIQTFAALVAPGLVMLILGGTLIGGGPDWQRVPGPYLAGAEQRSIDSESVAVAQWVGTYLPKGSLVAADSTFTRLLPNFAPVTTITQPAGFDSMTPLFIAHSVDQEVLRLILQNDVDFIVVDTRLVGQTVRSGGFFEGSTGYGPDAQTIKRDQVQKFEDQPGFDLVLDGPVKVYDVRPLRHAEQTFVHRDPPGLPGGWTPWQVARHGDAAAGRAARARPAARPAPVPRPRRVASGGDPAGRDGPRRRWRAGRVQPARRPDRRLGAALRAHPDQLAARAARLRQASSWAWGVPIVLIMALHHRARGVGGLARPARHSVLPPPAVGGGV